MKSVNIIPSLFQQKYSSLKDTWLISHRREVEPKVFFLGLKWVLHILDSTMHIPPIWNNPQGLRFCCGLEKSVLPNSHVNI